MREGEINRLPCVFERALLARHAVCELAASHQIAERETIACSQSAAHANAPGWRNCCARSPPLRWALPIPGASCPTPW
jgi:hypothetical protein